MPPAGNACTRPLQETLAGNPFSAFISFRLAGRRSCMCDSACTNCSRSALPTSTNTTNLQANACRRTFWPAWHGTYDAAEQLPQHALTQTDLYKICSHRIRPTAQIKSGPPPPNPHTHSTYPCVLQATRQQPKCRPVEWLLHVWCYVQNRNRSAMFRTATEPV